MNNAVMCKNYHLMLSYVDKYCRLRLSVLFKMFQDLAVKHASSLGVGREETLDRGFLWIVTKIKLEIIRLPVYGEDIILKTWPGETSRVYFPRYYELRSSSDELLARASSLWALIEGEKRSPVIPGAESIHVKGHISGNELLLPTGLRIPDNEACKTDSALRTVLYSDIDMNGHMNNTKYLDWIDDFLGDDFHKAHSFKAFQINFISEATLGMNVRLEKFILNDEIYVKGLANDKNIFLLHALYV